MKDLPAAVQKTVQDTLKGAEIKNISKEVEKGVTQYEVETMLNGKHRDFNVDAKGKLIVVEEEVDIAGIPAPAKAAIEKKVAGGKLGWSNPSTKGDGVMLYEAAYTSKAGKKGAVSSRPTAPRPRTNRRRHCEPFGCAGRRLLLAARAVPAWSQAGSGSIRGQVTDPSGKSIPDASVTPDRRPRSAPGA